MSLSIKKIILLLFCFSSKSKRFSVCGLFSMVGQRSHNLKFFAKICHFKFSDGRIGSRVFFRILSKKTANLPFAVRKVSKKGLLLRDTLISDLRNSGVCILNRILCYTLNCIFNFVLSYTLNYIFNRILNRILNYILNCIFNYIFNSVLSYTLNCTLNYILNYILNCTLNCIFNCVFTLENVHYRVVLLRIECCTAQFNNFVIF
ncbi:hypothetical protein M153_478000771 [Pseudoloma neurophilia]|uniref:Uncharacterized protein n=1 Tax=Pseudoloma neurophilia TaxID=146866 RepID=A0A0R0M4G7_9MICR|nr:hypothetical protein M153_478000771 [Pseudoloma neurophilia]